MAESVMKWEEPQEVTLARKRLVRREVREFMLGALAPTCLILGCLVLPAVLLIPVEYVTWKWLGFCAPLAILFVYAGEGSISSRECKLSARGICRGQRLWTWKMISGCRVTENSLAPNCRSLVLYRKRGRLWKWELALPGGPEDEQIISAASERVQLLREEPAAPPIPALPGSKGSALLYLLALAFGVAVGYAIGAAPDKAPLRLLAAGTLAFGPGTIGCLAIFRGKMFRQSHLWALAALFNLLGLSLAALYWIVFGLRSFQHA